MGNKLERRNFLSRLSLGTAAAIAAPFSLFSKNTNTANDKDMNPIKQIKPLGFQWETADPFLFCVHHEDKFPQGNEVMGPVKEHFQGRHMGEDFLIKDGFRMYHGKAVHGFPGNPHRGLETITVVLQGLVDHADSLGAAGRYGNGDVQWMTAGKGVQHSEMFPLLKQDEENPMELFQIWLNLPRKSKMVEPHFKMLWRESIPNYEHTDKNNKKTKIEVIVGKLDKYQSQTPPPDSWAADPNNEVAIWNIKMEAGATWTLPKVSAGINRTVYFYEGSQLTLANEKIPSYHAVELDASQDILLVAGSEAVSILMFQ